MKVFVIGSLNMDLVVKAPYMPRSGETMHGSDFMTNPGGKGANQAAALAKLGADVHMVGCVGSAFGRELIDTLAGYGAKTECIEICPEVSSGIAVIVVVDGDNRIILDAGANGKVSNALVDRALALAQPGDFLVVQLEISLDVVGYAMKKAREKGLTTVLNPAPAAKLPEGILACCDYFMPNQTETQFYTGVYPSDAASARRCAEILRRQGVKNVVITMGQEGSVGICGGEFVKVAATRVQAVDTTAAGDTFVGAFVTGLSEGMPVAGAMDFASRASAVTVTRRGAQRSIPYRAEVL